MDETNETKTMDEMRLEGVDEARSIISDGR